MKNILVCTDFSPNAHQAALFAAKLAAKCKARVVLFHAYHPAVLLEENTIWADPVLLENEVQEKIDQLAHELHTSFGVSVTRILKPGFPVEEIMAVVPKIKADLVVLGLHGAGKRQKTGAGKVTAEVLKRADFPVINVLLEATPENFTSLFGMAEIENALGNIAGLELVKRNLPAAAEAIIPDLATEMPDLLASV
jgi:nucleotide-binding universal stress UspA family protein